MNNVLIMGMPREMGHYAGRTAYVELILNYKYEGLFVLMEKLKRQRESRHFKTEN